MLHKLVEEIQPLLNQTVTLIDKHDRHETKFVNDVKSWLAEAEIILKKYNRPQVSQIAGLRGTLSAAEKGFYDVNYNFPPRTPNRKIATSIAIFSLQNAQNILNILLVPINQKIEKATTVLKQILNAADQKGLLATFNDSPPEIKESPLALWQHLKTDLELKLHLNQTYIFVSQTEAVVLLGYFYKEWLENGNGN